MVRVEFNKDRDMVRAEDTSPEHVGRVPGALDKSGGYRQLRPFTPFLYHEDGTPPKSTITFPGGTGGVNWGGTAADPTTGLVYMNAHDTSLVGWVEKKKPGVTYSFDAVGSEQAYDRASVNGVGPFFTFSAPLKDASGKCWRRACRASVRRGASSSPSTPTPARWRGGARSASPKRCRRGSSSPETAAARPERHRRRPRVRRRHQRSPLSRLRRQDRQGAVERTLERNANANPMSYQGANANSTSRSSRPIPCASSPCA
jgi:hypothetical protein